MKVERTGNLLIALIFGLVIMLFVSGCLDQGQEEIANETSCPEGFQMVNGTCESLNGPEEFTIEINETFVVSGISFELSNILYDYSIENGKCVLSDTTAVLKKKINETSSETVSIDLNGQLQVRDAALTFKALDYDYVIKENECKAEDIDVTLLVQIPEFDKNEFTLGLDDTHELLSGDELGVDSIKYNSIFDESIDLTVSLDENENSQISGDLKIKFLEAVIQTTLGDYSEEEITRGEGMVSLPGDYSMEIVDISMTVNPPDSDTSTDTYEEGDTETYNDDTTLEIEDITISMTNCTDNCTITNKTVTLKVRPEGAGSYEYYNLTEGEGINASALVTVEVLSIDADEYCYTSPDNSTECRFENATVDLRATIYDEHCSLSDKQVEIRLIRPDATEEDFTLDYGERREFLTDEVVEVLSIDGSLSDSYGGICNLTDEEVTLYVKVPTETYALSSAKAKLKITYKNDESTKTLSEGQTTSVGDDINLTIDKIDVILDDTGDVEDATVEVHINAPDRCRESGREITLQYGNNKVNVEEGDEFTIDNVKFEVVSITATVIPMEDRCEITNKKVRLREYMPIIETITLNLEESETIGDLSLTLEGAILDIEKDDETKECSLVEKGIQIDMVTSDTEMEKSADEGDVYTIGDYQVTIEEIDVDVPDSAEDTCEINNLSATFMVE